ncbi:hemerythrin domain-containing protein [Actimicrobium antarcticum]|uniref:Hemerythrin domain-containing protein n=1 Tax=Actimicrobium antarcticum TaxID=1051899 RepID=A0ABP7TEJ6_9BURK
MNALFDTAPDFGQPIAVLKHCHDRIRKQLDTLARLPEHLAAHGADREAQHAASAVLRYFDKAAPHHHQDEEQDLLPMLDGMAEGDDRVALDALLPELLAEHQQMDQLWNALKTALTGIASGASTTLSEPGITYFSTTYRNHMHKEESTIAPMAKRLFSSEQMSTLGNAMQQRRSVPATTGSNHVDR